MKVCVSAVDIRRQDSYTELARLVYILRRLRLVSEHRREQCSYIFTRIMCFQIRRAEGYHRICSRMALIECVSGKARHIVKQHLCFIRSHPAPGRPADKFIAFRLKRAGPLPLDVLQLLFGHCPADHVGLAQGVARQLLEDLHHLLLVNDASVCLFKHRAQKLRWVFHRLGRVFAGDVFGD